jgi:hypothetical protein
LGKYRICFLSQAGEVFGEKVLYAVRNYEALELAGRLADAAQYAGFELWNRHRRIARQLRNGAGKRKIQSRPSSA